LYGILYKQRCPGGIAMDISYRAKINSKNLSQFFDEDSEESEG
jgi:hypothetical protein